jgi:hypothetical protein
MTITTLVLRQINVLTPMEPTTTQMGMIVPGTIPGMQALVVELQMM